MARTIASTSDYITQGTVAIPSTGTHSIWFKPTWAWNDGADHKTFRVRNDTGGVHLFDGFTKGTDNRFYSGWYNAASGTPDCRAVGMLSAALVQNAWNHWAMTWATGAKTRCFLNGVLMSNDTVDVSNISGWNTAGTTRYYGKDAVGNSGCANCDIAHAAFWSIILNDDEIRALAKGVLPKRIHSEVLESYLPMFGLASPEPDASGNQANGTVTGTAFATGPPVQAFTRKAITPCNVTSPSVVLTGSSARRKKVRIVNPACPLNIHHPLNKGLVMDLTVIPNSV
jgi:hypothetical protein